MKSDGFLTRSEKEKIKNVTELLDHLFLVERRQAQCVALSADTTNKLTAYRKRLSTKIAEIAGDKRL